MRRISYRAWLDWSQLDLAERAHVSLSTIRDFEKGRRMPIENNITPIVTALRQAGVTATFGDDGQPSGLAVRTG